MYMEGLDELDNKILNIIKDDARLSYSEIGEKAGISRISVKKRMDLLEEKGIIQGYQTVIDSTKVPGGISFYIDMETTPESYEDVLEALSKSSYIRKIYSVSGECAIHATGFVSNTRNLQIFANALYRNSNRGIRRISCKTVLSTVMDRDGGIAYERHQESEYMETGDSEV